MPDVLFSGRVHGPVAIAFLVLARGALLSIAIIIAAAPTLMAEVPT